MVVGADQGGSAWHFPMRILSVIAVAIVVSSPVMAENWRPLDNVALSIPGKVTFTSGLVVFQNGKALAIREAGTTERGYRIFRVVRPEDPVMLMGNKLCGRGPVTFLTVAGQGGERNLSVYSSPTAPVGKTPSCGDFSFEVGR